MDGVGIAVRVDDVPASRRGSGQPLVGVGDRLLERVPLVLEAVRFARAARGRLRVDAQQDGQVGLEAGDRPVVHAPDLSLPQAARLTLVGE